MVDIENMNLEGLFSPSRDRLSDLFYTPIATLLMTAPCLIIGIYAFYYSRMFYLKAKRDTDPEHDIIKSDKYINVLSKATKGIIIFCIALIVIPVILIIYETIF